LTARYRISWKKPRSLEIEIADPDRISSSCRELVDACAFIAEWTDDALVAAAGADEAAFEQLFERHRRQVARIAGRFFSQRDQIEDIIQDSFTKAYFALNTYHGTHEASFRAWLTQIAVTPVTTNCGARAGRPEHAVEDFDDHEAHEFFRAASRRCQRCRKRPGLARFGGKSCWRGLSADDRLVADPAGC